MVLSLIADGGSTRLQQLGQTIGGVGQKINQNRLLKLQNDRQAKIDGQNDELFELKKQEAIGKELDRTMQFNAQAASILANTPDEQLPSAFNSLVEQGRKAGLDTSDLEEDAARLGTDFAGVRADISGAVKAGIQQGLLDGDQTGLTAGQREFEAFTEGLSDSDRLKARRIELGLDPRAQGSADITIATGGLTDQVGASQAAIAGQERTEKDKVGRLGNLVERGTKAAESIGTLRRGIELLQQVETGGINAVALRAKQAFGVEGADEGELSANLGKAVLAQLRETFGAQFTQQEGDRLARIEAGFSKSNETNIRLLERALNTVDRIAKRGLKAAEELEDDFSIEDINSLLNSGDTGGNNSEPQVLRFDANGNLIE